MKSKLPDFQAHEQVLKSIRLYDPQTVPDGPVVPTRYAAAKPRLLWVLRETNGGGTWDLCDFLRDHSKLFGYSRWHCTYGAVAKISFGLIKGLAADDIGKLGARDVVDTLRDVAVINVNKRGGEGRVARNKLAANAEDFKSFVELQIAALAPEIIIAAGTASLLPDSLREYNECIQGCVIGAVQLNEKAWLVKCYHTGQRKVRHAVLYERIFGALRKAGWMMRHGVENGR
jgi:hypothetical protein